jgi:hypothetical protein
MMIKSFLPLKKEAVRCLTDATYLLTYLPIQICMSVGPRWKIAEGCRNPEIHNIRKIL